MCLSRASSPLTRDPPDRLLDHAPGMVLSAAEPPPCQGGEKTVSAADGILEALAGLELGLGGFLNLHRLAGARVPAGRGLALGAGESAEADQANLVAALQGGRDRIEHA